MPMQSDQIKEMKGLIQVSRKRDVNFALCLGSKPEDTGLMIHKNKDGKTLVDQAKAMSGGTKTAYGSMRTDGKVVNFTVVKKPPTGIAATCKKFFTKNGLQLKVKVLSETREMLDFDLDDEEETSASDTSSPDPQAGQWAKIDSKLGPLLTKSFSHLPDGGKLRTNWNYAQEAAQDGDFSGAIKVATRIEDAFGKAMKAFSKSLTEKAMARFEEIKAAISNDDRNDLRKKIGIAIDAVKDSNAQELRAKFDDFHKTMEQMVKETRKSRESQKEKANQEKDEAQKALLRRIKPLNDELTKAEKAVERIENQLDEAKKLLNGPSRPKKKAAEKLAERIERMETEVEEAKESLKSKRTEVEPQLKELQREKDQIDSRTLLLIENIDSRLNGLTKKKLPFQDVRNSLKDTIGEMADATEWREEELKRNIQGGSHGTTRHGPQTGIDRQARRAATDGVTPDSSSPDQTTNQTRGTGATTHIKEWNKVSIEYEEDEAGKRKIKSRNEIQRKILDEVRNVVTTDKASMFANPVLEKQAVDRAIKKVKGKGWNQIYSNTRDWHDFTEVTVTLGPPTGKYPGWGYQVSRKEVAAKALETANAVLDKFEKGQITADKMLDDLGVEYLTRDGGVEMIHNAVVVLKRDTGTADWKSYTHYPKHFDTGEKPESWDIENRRVKKNGRAEERATY